MGLKGTFVLVGGGAMGSALLKGWLKAKLLKPSQVVVADLDPAKRARLKKDLKVRVSDNPAEAVKKASTILLAVKPQHMKELLTNAGSVIPRGTLVVSIAAGVSTAQIENRLAHGNPVVRVMPNTPALLGAGMAAVAGGKKAKKTHRQSVVNLFSAVGRATEVPERLLDLVTGLSGSGPAYFFLMIEALTEAGRKGGLDAERSRLLAAQTALGAARMVLETGEDPALLRQQVTSPGGTTLAGLTVLGEKGFSDALIEAVGAATRRGAELRRMND